MIILTDANNYARRVFEVDPTGLAYRKILRDVQFSKDVNIFVWDSYNSNARRREIYPQYKMRRVTPGEDMFKSMKMLKDVLRHSHAMQIEVPTYEADDVISSLCTSVADRIHIVSTDRDFLQLASNDGRVTCDATPKTGVQAKDTLLYKITVGDASDNISGCKGFGHKSYEAADKAVLKRFIKSLIYKASFDKTEIIQTVKPALVDWMIENAELIRTYNKIINFFDVSQDLLDKNLKIGDRNYAKADAMLKEFYL